MAGIDIMLSWKLTETQSNKHNKQRPQPWVVVPLWKKTVRIKNQSTGDAKRVSQKPPSGREQGDIEYDGAKTVIYQVRLNKEPYVDIAEQEKYQIEPNSAFPK